MSPEEPTDPNMHWDGTRWLRYDGQQWTDATTGEPLAAEPAVTPGGAHQWLGLTPPKKPGLVIGIVAAAVVVLIIIIVAVVAGGKKDTAPSPSAPSVALRTTAETCESIINLINAQEYLDVTPEQAERMRSEIPRAQQPLKEHITALVASYEALALITTPPPDPSDPSREIVALEAEMAATEAWIKSAEAINKACEALGGVAPPVTEPAEPAGPTTTIDEGDWTVGVDIKPGTYRTTEPVSGDCYWGIYRAGSNQSDIIDNGIPTGGRPTVTLKKGQEFTNQGCGTFALVK